MTFYILNGNICWAQGGNLKIARFFRLNYYINAPRLRVIDETGKQLGILPREEALNKAKSVGLDLVEIAPTANPPVAKIIDFKKFKYEESKKVKLSRKKTKESHTKEVWLGPLISSHDLQTRLDRAKEFLQEGNRVKLSVRFSGREMAHPELGREVLKNSAQYLSSLAKHEREPRFEGRNLTTTFVHILTNKQL